MAGFIEGVNRDQTTLFPERLEDWICEDHLVRVVDLFVDELDLAALGFHRHAAARTGRPGYLRHLPAPLAAINLRYGLSSHRAGQIKTFETEDGRVELRAVTGPDYGWIYDHELVEAVQRIAGNGTGDTRWKVPGVLDWSTAVYNPDVEISRDTTTLYASDRDVFVQGITRLARDKPHQDARLDLEGRAKKLLDCVG